LTGLNSLVPYYDYALDMVLDVEMPMEDSLTEEQQEIVESAAVNLLPFIRIRDSFPPTVQLYSRFILTSVILPFYRRCSMD